MKNMPIKTESLFGKTPDICKKRIKNWNRRKNIENTKMLIIDDKDGQIGMCPLRSNISITVFEPNEIYINGGKCDIPINIPDTNNYVFVNRTILGFKDRINNELINFRQNIFNKNYYEVDHYDEYDYVIACRSLDRKENLSFSMDEKINKLKSNVKVGGYLYIEYLLSLDESDEEMYPKDIYLKRNQIEKYFPKNEWTILSNNIELTKEEITPLNILDKNILIGKLDVVRKSSLVKTRKPKSFYSCYDSNEKYTVNHKYIINGVLNENN